ncbi:hemerythrin domain-containing protein [Diaphorobacter sp. HDW4A]|uniref:hemerythrin domain-containing protein n=1 Tax=Diaphorobacter sp. HDW4A TaxID=2714924 RepID=UPI00140CB2C7|nr:hemerythrin domain-containing protein [Diaphorobacter sp. HDW4A]QIL81996.1 hemerythrin domain-containing protein [Diaphorobacter sp. HDW4A]
MNTRISLPGLRSPGVGFEQPFEMLDACHDRVQRSLQLLVDLRVYLRANGCDDSVRQAARDVQRYFDIAAPLHHQDEELHVFPALKQRCADDAHLQSLVLQLQQDHEDMHRLWSDAVRNALAAIVSGAQDRFTESQESAFDVFAQCYARHLKMEDEVAYPQARLVVSEDEQQTMGREMAARRQG